MIIFTAHARMKLVQRNIKKETVIQTIKNPDHEEKGRADRKVVYKKFRNVYLKVIFKEEGKQKVIITQHWDNTFDI